MITYKEHYEKCRELYKGKINDPKHSLAYDVVVDEDLLQLDENYYGIIVNLAARAASKMEDGIGCYNDDYAFGCCFYWK